MLEGRMARELRPQITVQVAQTLDGRIALPQMRTVLSSPEGLEFAHRMRAQHDAVLVGSGTVKIDDPQLTVRYGSGPQPRRIVLASSLDIPATARLLAPGPGVLVIGAEGHAPGARIEKLTSAGAQVKLVPSTEDGLTSIPAALETIFNWGVRRLLVEGGARVLTSLFRQQLVDRVAFEIVTGLFGAPGLALLGNIGVVMPEGAPKLVDVCVKHLGTSILVEGRLEH